MDGEILQKRISSLASYLRSSVEQLLRDKLILKITGSSVNSSELSQNMVKVFQTTITSEREKYIEELISKLTSIVKEKAKIENEFIEMQTNGSKQYDDVNKENEQIRAQIEILQSKLKSMEWKQANREKMFKRQIKEKDVEASQVKLLVTSTQDAHQLLTRQLKDIRSEFARLQRNQTRLMGQAKAMCLTQINGAIENKRSNIKKKNAKRIEKIKDIISQEKKIQSVTEKQMSSLIDILNGLADQTLSRLNIGVDDFVSRTGEIRDYIDDIIEARKKNSIDEIKRQVAEVIPGIEIGNQNVMDAIDRHLKAKIKAKEAECQRIIKESEQREALLRQKLKEALERIQRLQNAESDYKYMDDFEKQKKEWENNGKKLDQTMIFVNKTRQRSRNTTTSDESK